MGTEPGHSAIHSDRSIWLGRPVTVGALLGVSALAWLTLALWGASPAGRLLDHGQLDAAAMARPILLAVFLAGWLLMSLAMMVPTVAPLVTLFATMVRRRPDRTRLLGLLLAGYLYAWGLFGMLLYLVDLAIHAVVAMIAPLAATAWLLGPMALVLAGLYQFSPLKHRCLDRCRSPQAFLLTHWQGGHPGARAAWLGLHHGLYCVGCCWALMLVLFALGMGNLGLMLLVGVVMGAEKTAPWGRRLSAPVGVGLVVWGVGLTLVVLLAP